MLQLRGQTGSFFAFFRHFVRRGPFGNFFLQRFFAAARCPVATVVPVGEVGGVPGVTVTGSANFWIRLLFSSATYTLPLESVGTPSGKSISPPSTPALPARQLEATVQTPNTPPP